MKEAKVIRVHVGALIEDPNNANKMSDEDFALLVSAIKRTGDMLQPILVQPVVDPHAGKDGPQVFKIVDGHHRARAAAQAGLTTILAVEWDGTDEMRRALSIGFNKIRGELDLAAVQRTLSELAETGWDTSELTITGYTEQEINDLLKVSITATEEEIMQNPIADIERDDSPIDRPLVLELTFASAEELKKAKRGLRRAAGKGRELGEGLLRLLGKEEES